MYVYPWYRAGLVLLLYYYYHIRSITYKKNGKLIHSDCRRTEKCIFYGTVVGAAPTVKTETSHGTGIPPHRENNKQWYWLFVYDWFAHIHTWCLVYTW